MGTEPALALTVVPGPQTQKEIENILDALERLNLAIEELRRRRDDGASELAQSLAKDLAAAPLNAETAAQKHKVWEANDEALAAKMENAEQLEPIIVKRIQELQSTQPEPLKAVLLRKIEQLEKEAAQLEDKNNYWNILRTKLDKTVAAKIAESMEKDNAALAFSTDDIALRAYYIAERRRNLDLPGDEMGDWLEAEQQLRKEASKRRPANSNLKPAPQDMSYQVASLIPSARKPVRRRTRRL